MDNFFGVPVFKENSEGSQQFLEVFHSNELDTQKIASAIEENKLVLIRSMSFDKASKLFSTLVDRYELRMSYDIQMQFVAHMMEGREAIDDVAVTVNKREPFEIIQPHAEGDSTSPLDLFGLYCTQNSNTGGENILSLINQSADHSALRAKEKVIVGDNLSEDTINKLKMGHLDANTFSTNSQDGDVVLKEYLNGKVVVRANSIEPAKSPITGENLYTHWDNVTVHDDAFHRYQFELLRHLKILNEEKGLNYKDYIHMEPDSDWGPVDTDSGDLQQTANLYSAHVLYKMNANDILIFNNRVWTHSVNNWPRNDKRELSAMYA